MYTHSLSYFGVLERRWGFLHVLPFSCGLGRQKSLLETALWSITSSPAHSTFSSPTGLWYYLQGQDRPCLTLIGSPNFGYRSVHRDLEAQIAIVTENEELQSQLQEVGSFFLLTAGRNDDEWVCKSLLKAHLCFNLCASQEQETLYQRSTEVSSSTFERPDRHVKLWVKLVTPLIKNFFWGGTRW